MKSLGIIGFGTFGRFMVRHLVPYFRIRVYDSRPDLVDIADDYNVDVVSLAACADSDVVVIATPVQTMDQMAKAIAPHIRPGALVMDVGSVKLVPAKALETHIPAHADIICTHPLFGPQSAFKGVQGLNISLCNIRGDRLDCVEAFLRERLGLNTIRTTPEAHDKELAYVQGLSHLIGKTLLAMKLETFEQTTVTYDLLQRAVSFIKDDSVELFRAIETENPYAAEVRKHFFASVKDIEAKLEDTPRKDKTVKR